MEMNANYPPKYAEVLLFSTIAPGTKIWVSTAGSASNVNLEYRLVPGDISKFKPTWCNSGSAGTCCLHVVQPFGIY